MKIFAKLVLFLLLSFIGILFLGIVLAILSDWTKIALIFPPERGILDVLPIRIADYMSLSLPAAFYISILLGLMYAVKNRIIYPIAFAMILTLILVFSGITFVGIESLDRMGVTITIKGPPSELANPGFIEANAHVGTNALEILVFGNEEQALITARFDNLGKGASGAAVQNMNLMLGLDEKAGLQ